MDASGKVAIVTGGARGLGRGYVEALLKRKAKVVITDILEERGQETESLLQEQYGKDSVLFLHGDVSKQDEMERVFQTAVDKFGSVDICINNAAVGIRVPHEVAVAVNLLGVVRCTELAQQHMSKSKGGHGGVIINISSIAGVYTKAGGPMYHSTKHAVLGYTCSLGKMLASGEEGIRAIALCPGFVKTEFTTITQQAEASGVPAVVKILKDCGGWTELADVVGGCMKVIEGDVPSGSAVLAVPDGTFITQPETMQRTPLS